MSASAPARAPASVLRWVLIAFVLGAPCGLSLAGDATVEAEGCNAPPSPKTSLSLADAVDLALCNNAQIRESWAVIRGQRSVVDQANAAYWPTLGATVGELHDRTSYPGSSVPRSDRTGDVIYAALDWRLFDFGGRGANHRAAQAQLGAAVASKDATIQRVLGATAQLYFEAYGARELARERQEAEEIAHETLGSAQRRAASGQGAQGDVLQSATALAKATLARNQADAAYEKARAQLAYLTGLPQDRAIELPAELSTPVEADDEALTSWLRDVEQHHPAIVSARANLDAAREHVSAVRAAGLPAVDLVANYYQNGFPNQGLNDLNTRVLTLGLSVNIPIFDGWATRSKVEEARALVKVKEAELADAEQSTSMAVVAAHADALASLRNLHASEDLLQAAHQSFESSQRRYQNGVGDMLELLSTQAARADAQEQRVRALADWQAARLLLLAAAGRLDRAAVRQ
jgi:outer membrane protein